MQNTYNKTYLSGIHYFHYVWKIEYLLVYLYEVEYDYN